MAVIQSAKSPGTRLRLGSGVLTAAKSVNVRPVQARFEAFGRAHRAYAAAHEKVEAAEAALQAAHLKLERRHRDQDQAVDLLARALISEGQSRAKPFAGFGGPTPAVLIHLPVTEAARQLQALVTALQRNLGFTKPTQQAIVAADAAARAVQKALEPAAGLQAALREARQQRDALGPTWQKALEALKRGARAAIDDGEPYLYATLFPPAPRAANRNGKAAPNGSPTPTPTPPAPVAPPVSSTT